MVVTPAFGGRLLETGPEDESYRGPAHVSEIPKFLQICSSVSESASVHDIVGDIPGCGNAGCTNVAEHSICRVFCGHLRLTCVEM